MSPHKGGKGGVKRNPYHLLIKEGEGGVKRNPCHLLRGRECRQLCCTGYLLYKMIYSSLLSYFQVECLWWHDSQCYFKSSTERSGEKNNFFFISSSCCCSLNWTVDWSQHGLLLPHRNSPRVHYIYNRFHFWVKLLCRKWRYFHPHLNFL